MTEVDMQQSYSDDNASTDDYLRNYTIDNVNQIVKLRPAPTTTTAILTLVYEKDIQDLSNYTDATIIPIPDLLIAYATARVWKLKSSDDEYQSWMQAFSELLSVLGAARPVTYHPKTLKRYQGPNKSYINNYNEDYI